MEYTEAQQKVIDRYLEATEHCPEDRLPIEKLIGMKSKFPKGKPDKYVVAKCEKELINDEDELTAAKKPGRKKRVIDNMYVRTKLHDYLEYDDAEANFYWLDDVMQGTCSSAFEGGTRHLSRYVVFEILSTAVRIDTALVQDVCNVQERQARKIMTALVFCNRAIEKEFRRMDMLGLTVERWRLYLT